jgi:hypothetical protein
VDAFKSQSKPRSAAIVRHHTITSLLHNSKEHKLARKLRVTCIVSPTSTSCRISIFQSRLDRLNLQGTSLTKILPEDLRTSWCWTKARRSFRARVAPIVARNARKVIKNGSKRTSEPTGSLFVFEWFTTHTLFTTSSPPIAVTFCNSDLEHHRVVPRGHFYVGFTSISTVNESDVNSNFVWAFYPVSATTFRSSQVDFYIRILIAFSVLESGKICNENTVRGKGVWVGVLQVISPFTKCYSLASKVRKRTNSTSVISRCALTWFRVEAITRVSRRAPFQIKECSLAHALVFSRHHPCWNVSGNLFRGLFDEHWTSVVVVCEIWKFSRFGNFVSILEPKVVSSSAL